MRIRGQILPGGVKIDLLSVMAPAGAKVRGDCRGRACGARRLVARAASAGWVLRLRRLERRSAPGAVLEVAVRKRGRIGKDVRFTIRRRAAPARPTCAWRRK